MKRYETKQDGKFSWAWIGQPILTNAVNLPWPRSSPKTLDSPTLLNSITALEPRVAVVRVG